MKYIGNNNNYSDPNHLEHYDVKGMKWGVRKAVRNAQYAKTSRDLSKATSERNEIDRGLNKLKGYSKNPSAIGNTGLETAIMNKQIRKHEKAKSELDKIIEEFSDNDDIAAKVGGKNKLNELKKDYNNRYKDLGKEYVDVLKDIRVKRRSK